MEELARMRVRLTSDLPRLEVAGRVYEGLKTGAVIEVPVWAADAMVKARVAEVVDELGVQQLRQISLRETRGQVEPVPLREDFYGRARHALRRAREFSGEEARRFEEALRDVIAARVHKVCVAATKGAEPPWLGNLTPEERRLYLRARELVEEFVSEALR
ncbi:MAG: hypothetical protein ABDH63_05065 [Candidatus Caldarchaeales archaeon]